MSRILLLEDDPNAASFWEEKIQRQLAEYDPQVEIVETESDFVLHWLPQFKNRLKQPPSIIVIDIMMRWTDPDPDQPPRPPEVTKGGFLTAGLRCLNHIRHEPLLSRTRVIVFTILSKDDLERLGARLGNVDVVEKDKDEGQTVIRLIHKALARSQNFETRH